MLFQLTTSAEEIPSSEAAVEQIRLRVGEENSWRVHLPV